MGFVGIRGIYFFPILFLLTFSLSNRENGWSPFFESNAREELEHLFQVVQLPMLSFHRSFRSFPFCLFTFGLFARVINPRRQSISGLPNCACVIALANNAPITIFGLATSRSDLVSRSQKLPSALRIPLLCNGAASLAFILFLL